MNGRKILFVLAMASFLTLWLYGHDLARAQEDKYPNKPVTIVVPYGPGGLVDRSVRVMTDYLSEALGVPVVIENHAGASGMLGATKVLKAKPDGYTVLASSDSAIVVSPQTSPNPPYDPFKDFLPLGSYGIAPTGLGVYKSSPFKDISELVADAKQEPGKLTCGVTSVGAGSHLAFELFRKTAGIKVKLVPYKGTGPAIAALLGQHIDMLTLSYIGFLPYVKSGEARVLAVTDSVSDASIPTFVEKGYSPTEMGIYTTFFVSSGTPKPVYEKLVRTFEKVANDPNLIKDWEKVGLIPQYKNPEQYLDFVKKKYQVVSELLDELGLKGKGN